MKLPDRINTIEGVEQSYWDNQHQRLVVYHSHLIPRETIHLKATALIADIQLQDSVKEITYISISD